MSLFTIRRTNNRPITLDTNPKQPQNTSKPLKQQAPQQKSSDPMADLLQWQQDRRLLQLSRLRAKLSPGYLSNRTKLRPVGQISNHKGLLSAAQSDSTLASLGMNASHRAVPDLKMQQLDPLDYSLDTSSYLVALKPARVMDPKLRDWKDLEDLIIGVRPKVEASAQNSQSASQVAVGNSELMANICLKGSFESDSISQSDQPCTIPVMITLEDQSSNKANSNAKVDIVCVLDISISMGGQRLKNVKSTMGLLLKLLNGHRLAIVLFGSSAEVWMNFKTVNSANQKKILEVIDHIECRGTTNITAGVHLAQNLLGSRRTKNQVSSVFLLSDGEHCDGPISQEILFKGDMIRAKTGYTLHTFGYGDDHEAAFLQSVAEYKGGNYYFIQDISKVDECFLDCLGMVTTILTSQATISIDLIPSQLFPEISIAKTYGPYLRKNSDTSAVISVPPINSGVRKDFLFEIEFDTPSKQILIPQLLDVIRARLECQEIETSSILKKIQFIQIQALPKESQQIGKKNPEVTKNYLRVKFAETLSKVEKLKSQGLFVRALGLLKDLEILFSREVELKEDPLVVSLKTQLEHITKMINNDRVGTENEYKTDNFITQQRNVYMNQQSAPQFGQEMYSSMEQTKNFSLARSLK